MQYLLFFNVFINVGIEKGEYELGEKLYVFNLILYYDQGFNCLVMYIIFNLEYFSWLLMNSL